MGSKDSAVSNALLDAAERVIGRDGYGAATSRRIAEEAGLKQQLVYYYFQSMDELLLATFKRRTAEALDRYAAHLLSDQPLRKLWEDYVKRTGARITFEFMALANHHEGIREEVARFVTEARRLQITMLTRVYKEKGVSSSPISPGAAAFLLASLAMLLSREKDTGIEAAHKEVEELVEWALCRFD